MLTSIRGLLAVTLLAGSALAAMPAYADEAAPPPEVTITGSAAVVSQYRFRGLAQSDNKPAVQAAITIAHKSGFYLSTWGSSASAGAGPINIGGTEIDIYGGWTHGIGDSGFTVDVGGYVQVLLLAMQAHGVAAIPQAALTNHSALVKQQLGIAPERLMVCGISFGYEDADHPSNKFRTSRADLFEVVSWVA